MLNVPNYIKNSDLENIIDKLAYDFSKSRILRQRYKEIFNTIYYCNIIDKSLNNEYNFAEIPTNTFKQITTRHYKKILIHMYDNHLIFTNVSIHKNSCGTNFKSRLPIKRAYRIDRSLSTYFNIQTGNLLDININKKEIPSLKSIVKKEKQSLIKCKKITHIKKKSIDIANFYNFFCQYQKSSKFAKYIDSKFIYYYNKAIKNRSDTLDLTMFSNNLFDNILGFNISQLLNLLTDYKKKNNNILNINLDNHNNIHYIIYKFINNNYNDINDIFIHHFSEQDLSREKNIFRRTKNINYYQDNIFDPIEHYVQNFYFRGYKTKRCKLNIEKLLLKRYDYLDIDVDKIPYGQHTSAYRRLSMIWNKHSKAKKSGSRIYSWFHQLKSQQRKYITLNGSHLKEVFDIPACNFCLLAKIFQNYEIDGKELSKFQNVVKNEYIYKKIAQFGGLQLDKIKKKLKASAQHWLNIRKRNFKNGARRDEYFNLIDEYFKVEFPGIRELIINYAEVQHNGKISKRIWMDFQAMEYQLISKDICQYLAKKYNVYAVTVHDAVYIPEDQFQYIQQPLENIFWKKLNLQYV